MNTKAINLRLIQDGRDLRYIEGFWAGYRAASLEVESERHCINTSRALDTATSDAEFMLAEERRKKQK